MYSGVYSINTEIIPFVEYIIIIGKIKYGKEILESDRNHWQYMPIVYIVEK